MNFVANAVLAAGASPIVSLYDKEIEELAGKCDSLYINIGCLDDRQQLAMRLAAALSCRKNIPWVLDPVAVAGSRQRAEFALELVNDFKPLVIRGNASEIRALASLVSGKGSYEDVRCGVDSELDSSSVIEDAGALSRACGCTVAMSGKTDYVVTPHSCEALTGGSDLMPLVTAMGCVASALCATFAATGKSGREAAVKALSLMNRAGEKAAGKCGGPGTFPAAFLDELWNECR